MSDYKYTDHNGDRLCIGSGVIDGTVWIQINHGDTGWVEEVKNEDAPAVALAILEAAGLGEGVDDYLPGEVMDRRHVAVRALSNWTKERAEQSEREAEDVKVREFLAAISGHPVGETAAVLDDHRRMYRAARECFHQEVTR